ncbi:hypothetical protein PV328_005217 [Microctonus aethiopoides]|uniref:Galactose mutarotase n=1 Tax=Microctonus aethiopoides TaxID=144406 RepID=A0AA39KS28_9HYME|nr:hypothetical protein PV328_005217 [Microctonus aethiopoides]
MHEDGFGIIGSDIIRRYTLTNKSKASVCLISFGAGIQSIRVPNKNGILGDVVLGWDDINGYQENRFIGRTIGRVTKTITDGIITIVSKKNFSSENYDKNNRYHFNSGLINFDNVNWDCHIIDKSVVMSYLSRNRSDGYPGDMLTQIKYTWTDDNQLFINIRATSTRSTVANISNYCLFNLAGHGTGAGELNKHIVTVNSDKWVHEELNKPPLVHSAIGTIFDLRKPTILSSKTLRQVPGGGFNHNLIINSPSTWCYRFHARVLHPKSGRFVEVYSNQPGIYLSTANNLPNLQINDSFVLNGNHWNRSSDVVSNDELQNLIEQKDIKLYGKGGILYKKHSGFLISPQNYSNFGSVKYFPSCVLHPGNIYQHDMSLKFGVKV